MAEKRKFPKGAFISILFGIGFVLLAIFGVNALFTKNKYSITIDRGNFKGVDVKIEITTDQKIEDVLTVYVEGKKHQVVVSQVDDETYKGSLHLSNDYFMMSEEDVVVKCYKTNGEELSFGKTSLFYTAIAWVLRILGFIFGGICLILGTIGLFVKCDAPQQVLQPANNLKVDNTPTIDADTDKNSDSVICMYCGCENDKKSGKCAYCNAPLSNKKVNK